MRGTKRSDEVIERERRKLFQFIRDYIEASAGHLAPTYGEIEREFNLSTSTVFNHLQHLERLGVITREKGNNRSIRIIGDYPSPDDKCGSGTVAELADATAAEEDVAADVTAAAPPVLTPTTTLTIAPPVVSLQVAAEPASELDWLRARAQGAEQHNAYLRALLAGVYQQRIEQAVLEEESLLVELRALGVKPDMLTVPPMLDLGEQDSNTRRRGRRVRSMALLASAASQTSSPGEAGDEVGVPDQIPASTGVASEGDTNFLPARGSDAATGGVADEQKAAAPTLLKPLADPTASVPIPPHPTSDQTLMVEAVAPSGPPAPAIQSDVVANAGCSTETGGIPAATALTEAAPADITPRFGDATPGLTLGQNTDSAEVRRAQSLGVEGRCRAFYSAHCDKPKIDGYGGCDAHLTGAERNQHQSWQCAREDAEADFTRTNPARPYKEGEIKLMLLHHLQRDTRLDVVVRQAADKYQSYYIARWRELEAARFAGHSLAA